MEKEWQGLPYESQQRLPITANIPYFFRWKLMQLKLLLTDLAYLADKYHIENARELFYLVTMEAEDLCSKLVDLIDSKRRVQQSYEEESETV